MFYETCLLYYTINLQLNNVASVRIILKALTHITYNI